MKNAFREYSAWKWVGNDVLAMWKRYYPKKSLTTSQICAILVAAINPATLEESSKNPHAGELARLYDEARSLEPELAKSIESTIRAKWNDPWAPVAPQIAKREATEILIDRRTRKRTRDAKNADFLKSKQTDTGIYAIKQARWRAKKQTAKTPPSLTISDALHAALLELKKRGFDVGDGNLNPPSLLP
jgi:hypothetical protein